MKKLLIASAALVAVSSAAQSADYNYNNNASAASNDRFPYWYVGISGGVAGQTDSDFDGSTSGTFKYDTGYNVTASLGYTPPIAAPFRFEGEISEHRQDFSRFDGDLRSDAIAFNAYYDFRNSSRITPYLGLGAGVARFHLTNPNASGISGTDTKGIWQGMAGLAYEPESIPDVDFTLGYRYFRPFSDPETDNGGGKVKYEYDNNSVEVGARFRF